jgi:hypothetical protein
VGDREPISAGKTMRLSFLTKRGRAEGPASCDAGEESSGLRLEEVEYGVALSHARMVCG